MRTIVTTTLFLLLLGGFTNSQAAENYTYFAMTIETSKAQGAVKAGSLTWNCDNRTCTITGPWKIPGVGACKTLATKIGVISSYGHKKNKLSADQLIVCNKNALMHSPSKVTTRPPVLSKNITVPMAPKHIKIPKDKRLVSLPTQITAPITGSITRDTSADASSNLAIEEASIGTYTLFIHTPTIEYHGRYEGAYEAIDLGSQRPRWADNVITTPPYSFTPTRHTTPETWSRGPHGSRPSDLNAERPGSDENWLIDVPVDFLDLPYTIDYVIFKCSFSQVRNFYAGGTRGLQESVASASNVIARAEATLYFADNSRDIQRTVHMPIKTRYGIEKEDIRSVQCSPRFMEQHATTRRSVPLEPREGTSDFFLRFNVGE